MPICNFPTPLRRAIRAHDEAAVRQVLKDAGTKEAAAKLINADHSPDCMFRCCTSVQGNALYYAVKYRHEEPIVKLLLEHGADVHDAGEYGETCLHAVCRYNFTNTCKMLIQYGADVYATDDQGRYPIHSCANSVYNNERTLKFLLDEAGKRSDVTLKDFNERTPLHEAAYIRNASNVEVLIAYGADVNAQSRSGLTPLHLTSRGSPVWEILVRHGADTTIKNKQGQLPGEIM